MPNEEKSSPGLTIDKAAFLLLRVKRAFKKKKQQKKEKNNAGGESILDVKSGEKQIINNYGKGCNHPHRLLRSRTLPAIIVPGINVYQKLLDPNYSESNQRRVSESIVDWPPRRVDIKNDGKSSYNCQPTFTKFTKLLNQRSNYNTDDVTVSKFSWEKRNNNEALFKSTKEIPFNFPVPSRSTSIDSINDLKDWGIINRTNIVTSSEFHICNRTYKNGFGIKTEPCSPTLVRSPNPSQINSQALFIKGRYHERHSSVSSSISRKFKGHRTIHSELQAAQKMDFLEGFGKKKSHQQFNQEDNHLLTGNINPLSGQTSINNNVHALFTAVECGLLEKTKILLDSTDVDVNSVNSDGLSPLDIAVLNHNKSIVKLLIEHGAQEGTQFRSPEQLENHLSSLMISAEQKLAEGGGSKTFTKNALSFLESTNARTSFSMTHNNLTGCGGNAEDKQMAVWERRVRSLRKIMLGFSQARPPDASFGVMIDVIGTRSVNLKIRIDESSDSYICTKFKVQWSTREDFSSISGEQEIFCLKQKECVINGLVHGQQYFFRACLGNLKGYGTFVQSFPRNVTPSSWRDIDGRSPRFAGKLEQLDSLFIDIQRPEYAQQALALQRRNHKKKTTIKHLFTATSKFQKNLRRGIYLVSILYHEDKVLVTSDDFLPAIEIDETYPSCIYNDFHWLMKIACTWDNVKSLKLDMEKSQSSSINHFRLKLLQAAVQMQTALCIQDLGQIYYKPIRDIQGTLVISTINQIKSPKIISVLNSRWVPINKLVKKFIIQEDSNVAEILMANIQEQITYYELSNIKLNKGLYLGYLKMQSSVDLIQLVVSSTAPNILPHCKIRDNAHVSAEEWGYLKKITHTLADTTSEDSDTEEKKKNLTNSIYGSEQAKLFIDGVANAAYQLFSYMNIKNDDAQTHRFYDAEVIELTSDVSFLILVPPVDAACLVPGTREILLHRDDLITLPIQVFEMVHLNAYQKDVINCYSRLSCILELDTAQAVQNHREAFSSSEVITARDKLAKLQDLQTQVNNVWKSVRWLIDVITFARDRASQSSEIAAAGICMKHLLSIAKSDKCNDDNFKRNCLLQLPARVDSKVIKSSPGRGSWPGPNAIPSTNLLRESEFSKSEQLLPRESNDPNIEDSCNTINLNIISDRKRNGSDLSNFSTDSDSMQLNNMEFANPVDAKLSASKSEDVLFVSQHRKQSEQQQIFTTKQVTPIPTTTTVSTIKCNSTNKLNVVESSVYENSSPSTSTMILTDNTTMLTNDNNIDNAYLLNIENYNPVPCSSIVVKAFNSTHTKSRLMNPTASVAAFSTTPLLDNVNEFKNRTLSATTIPGILQVFAAYKTGLAAGTSLKLHVTPRTTAREVVDLVVKQLNMAIVLKGQDGPIYSQEDLPNFCLVAVIGARERCLRDDFKPLQLQNPWKKGRLYVRLKQDVLAALEQSNKHTAYL